MHIINTKVVQPQQDFLVCTGDPFFIDGYPIVSELDCEEVIQNYLKQLRKEGHQVTREMVPKEPTASVYTMRKRKSKRKAETQEEQVKPDLLTQKKIKMEQAAELRTKHKHEAPAERVVEESSRAPKRKMQLDDDADSEGTDSDEQTLASRLQQKQAPAPKGKALKISSETDKELGYSKPLR
ncbi:hypothetical protein L195_g050837, partial [Trifolium pratense]